MADSNETSRLWAALTHPITTVSGVIATLAHFQAPFVDAIVLTAWQHASLLFAGVSLGGNELLPRLGVSQTMVDGLLLIAGALFLAKILDTLWDGFRRRLDRQMEDTNQ